MSAKITGTVWDLDLSVPWRMVLLAMVDHADHDGAHMRASQSFIAWKTGYSVRNVARIIQDMITAGLLILTDEVIGEENEYRIDLSAARSKPAFSGRKPRKTLETPAILSGVRGRTPDKMAGVPHAKMADPPDKMAGVPSESPPTHAKMADPPDKMAGGTHAKMAIDSISTIVGVGDLVGGDRARGESSADQEFIRQLCARRAQGKPMNLVSAQRIAARVADGHSDVNTVLASLDALIADNEPMGVIIGLLSNDITIPPKGQPYEQRPISTQHAPDATAQRKPSERIGERPTLPPGLRIVGRKHSTDPGG